LTDRPSEQFKSDTSAVAVDAQILLVAQYHFQTGIGLSLASPRSKSSATASILDLESGERHVPSYGVRPSVEKQALTLEAKR
jgi:hypothetical protein